MRNILATAILAVLLTTTSVLADGVVTTPTSNPATNWKIGSIEIDPGTVNTVGGPQVRISIAYFDSSQVLLKVDVIFITVGAELNTFLAQILVPASGENGTNAKKFRMRVTKWLVDNNKLSNVTPE